jgi:hypothetical protein
MSQLVLWLARTVPVSEVDHAEPVDLVRRETIPKRERGGQVGRFIDDIDFVGRATDGHEIQIRAGDGGDTESRSVREPVTCELVCADAAQTSIAVAHDSQERSAAGCDQVDLNGRGSTH